MTVSGMSYTAVRRNTVGNSTLPYSNYAGIETGSTGSYNVITDNVIDDGHNYGIAVSIGHEDHYLIAHNQIQNADLYGILAAPDRIYIYQNDIRDCGSSGIILDDHNGKYAVVDSNTIADNGGNGIEFIYWDDYLTVINNSVTGQTAGAGAAPRPYQDDHLEWDNNTLSGNGNNDPWIAVGYDNDVPTIDIGCPTKAMIGQNVSFQLNFADTDGTFGDVLWDFGEGVPSGVENPTYANEEPGEYRIMAVAWDDYGRGVIDTAYITIFTPIPGDLDSDGFVGGADLDIIRSFWGQTVTPGNLLHGDPSGNGVCSGQDLDLVRAHWGESIPPSVPEPSALILLAGAVTLFVGRRMK